MANNQTHTKIKSLQVHITKLEEEIKNFNNEINDIKLSINTKQQLIQNYSKELQKLKSSSNDIIISEHAILRYIERVMKIDMEKLTNEIISNDLKKSLPTLGNGTYPYNNHLLKVVDNVVVTVTSKDDDLSSLPPKPKKTPKTHHKIKQTKKTSPKESTYPNMSDYDDDDIYEYGDGDNLL